VRDRPEYHAVGGLGGLDRRIGQGGAVRAQGGETDGDGSEGKSQLERMVDRPQHGERRGRDFGPDAVALHDDKPNRRGRRGGHRSPPLLVHET
jgi:hypothetical protein